MSVLKNIRDVNPGWMIVRSGFFVYQAPDYAKFEPYLVEVRTKPRRALDQTSVRFVLIKADVFFKLENDPAGQGKICEVQLSAPGPNFFAISQEKNFELAAKKTVAELEKQLKKRKAVLKPY